MSAPVVAVRKVLSRYATFSGRATRAEFWWWTAAVFALFFVTSLIDGALIAPILGLGWFPEEGGQPLSVIVSLGLIVPCIAVGARRLHDTDRTAWWLLVGLVPVVGALVLLYFYILPGDEGPNGFGVPEPLGAD